MIMERGFRLTRPTDLERSTRNEPSDTDDEVASCVREAEDEIARQTQEYDELGNGSLPLERILKKKTCNTLVQEYDSWR